MGASDKRFIPLGPLIAAQPNRLSPVWMYPTATRTEVDVERPSINGSDRAPEVNRSRSSSDDGSYEGADFPLAATGTEGGSQGRLGKASTSWWTWMKKHRKLLLLLMIFGSIFLAVISFIASLTRHSSPPPVTTPAPAPAPPPSSPYFKAVVTWNNYTAQGGTVCGPKAPGVNSTHFGAAASDVSPDISGGKCEGSIDPSICDKSSGKPPSTYVGPSCPRTNCGFCYRLYSLGFISSSSPIQNTSTFPPDPTPRSLRSLPNASVQIIDSCPASNAANYCKMFGQVPVPADQRCGDPTTNAIDVDIKGWAALSGVKNASVEDIGNLWVWGEKVTC